MIEQRALRQRCRSRRRRLRSPRFDTCQVIFGHKNRLIGDRSSYTPSWVPGGFAANGHGDLSSGEYALPGCFLTEVVMTFVFPFIIIGTSLKGAVAGFAGIPIGLGLTLIYLVSIPVTSTSVNPVRNTRPAWFAGGAYMGQLMGFGPHRRVWR